MIAAGWTALDSMRECFSREIPEGGFTAKEYAARYSLPSKTALAQLTGMADAGKLESKKIILRGRITNVYWIPPAKKKRTK